MVFDVSWRLDEDKQAKMKSGQNRGPWLEELQCGYLISNLLNGMALQEQVCSLGGPSGFFTASGCSASSGGLRLVSQT